MKIVKVVWIDAQDHPQKWADEQDVHDWSQTSCEIVSVGILVSKTAKYITLAGDWDPDDKDYGRVTKIPVAWIQSEVELKEEGTT